MPSHSNGGYNRRHRSIVMTPQPEHRAGNMENHEIASHRSSRLPSYDMPTGTPLLTRTMVLFATERK